jgi:hypothetical protein
MLYKNLMAIRGCVASPHWQRRTDSPIELQSHHRMNSPKQRSRACTFDGSFDLSEHGVKLEPVPWVAVFVLHN